jgi:hypothetical protein
LVLRFGVGPGCFRQVTRRLRRRLSVIFVRFRASFRLSQAVFFLLTAEYSHLHAVGVASMQQHIWCTALFTTDNQPVAVRFHVLGVLKDGNDILPSAKCTSGN